MDDSGFLGRLGADSELYIMCSVLLLLCICVLCCVLIMALRIRSRDDEDKWMKNSNKIKEYGSQRLRSPTGRSNASIDESETVSIRFRYKPRLNSASKLREFITFSRNISSGAKGVYIYVYH